MENNRVGNKELLVARSGIERYVDGCSMCQRIKNRMEAVMEKFKLSEVPKKL